MIISKDYLVKVQPKIVGIAQQDAGHFIVTCEQGQGGNYCDQAYLSEQELFEILTAGLKAKASEMESVKVGRCSSCGDHGYVARLKGVGPRGGAANMCRQCAGKSWPAGKAA